MSKSENTQQFPLRIPPSVRQEASELAAREGISLNQFIVLAVVEKLSKLDSKSKAG